MNTYDQVERLMQLAREVEALRVSGFLDAVGLTVEDLGAAFCRQITETDATKEES